MTIIECPKYRWEPGKRELIIPVPEPFDFGANLQYMGRAANECLYRIKEERIYKALAVGDTAFVLEISEGPEHTILVRFPGESAPSDRTIRDEIARYVSEWFDLDTDLHPFYAMAEHDPLLQQAVQAFHGLRIIGIPDLFEAISWGIIGQQINLGFAYTLKRRLVEYAGRRVVCEGEEYWLFPTPEAIAGLTAADLDGLRMTLKKCEYLIDVAKLIADGSLSRELLIGDGSLVQAEKRLTGIRGIGPWTANYVLMRCLRMPDAFPIDDVGLHNAIKHLQGLDRKPTKAELRALAAGWTGWEAYATFYLWRFLY